MRCAEMVLTIVYNRDFTISYLATDDTGEEVYLSLLSDWDLDAAFFSASNPLLRLKVDVRPFEEGVHLYCKMIFSGFSLFMNSFMIKYYQALKWLNINLSLVCILQCTNAVQWYSSQHAHDFDCCYQCS
jgi:hypothetical protein